MRKKLDFYPTQKKLVDNIGDLLSINHSYYEPCNGEGHISNILREKGINIVTSDIVSGSNYQRDATSFVETNYDFHITNPPFKWAYPILKNSIRGARIGVIFLVRITFLEPTYDRQDFLNSNPPSFIVVNPRTSFTNDGKTDSTTTAWLGWMKFWTHQQIRIAKK